MSLVIDAGKAVIKSPSGRTLFDTDDGLFTPLSVVSGTVAIAAYTNPDGTNADVTTSYALGACNAACTDVIGSVKFTLNNYIAGFPFDRWQSVMGGSIVWVLDGHQLFNSSPDRNTGLTQMVFYSLRVTSGQVYLDRRMLFSNNGQGSYTILAHSIAYKLKAGVYL